jgi:SHS2 domain-containing protein
MSHTLRADAGHLVRAHSSSTHVEAWAPSRSRCLEELVRAVVETFGQTRNAPPTRTMPFRVGATSDTELMLALLDDLYFLVDTDGFLVSDVSLHDDGSGNLDGTYSLAPVDDLVETMSVRKGTIRSGAKFAPDGLGWRARVVIDS